jgi:hypothetical protein
MTFDLFTPQVETARQHQVFRMLLDEQYAPERAVLNAWARGFEDRDGKFVQEFQMTFESGLWELYLNAALRGWGLSPDMSFASPDFVVGEPMPLCVEAAIAAPAKGGKAPIGYSIADIPDDFTEFNREVALRICNSFNAKVRRYRNYYSTLPHVADKPFVIGIGAFDRPLAHFAASRPIFAALYGLYHDESATPRGARRVVSYNVSSAAKSETVDIPLGLFCDDQYAEVSAVVYSSLATWGKVRALADNPLAKTVYTTYHPNGDDIKPRIKATLKAAYEEHLLDGAYVLHNPFARRPIAKGMLSHARVAEVHVATDGELLIDAPEDFLLVRTLMSVRERA